MKAGILIFPVSHPDFSGIASEWSARMLMRKCVRMQNKMSLNAKQIVADYSKGKYKQDIHAYSREFSRAHETVDLYQLAIGRKLSCSKKGENFTRWTYRIKN